MFMQRGLSWLLGFALGANGLWMLADPDSWYRRIPGVIGTGPANDHFIRDIGCAYLVAGLSLLWLASSERAWPAALTAGAFLTLHAVVHVWDALAGRESAHQLLLDLPTVVAPGLVVLWLAASARRDLQKE
jgi:uncharacterized protein YjeT (DUF2065 family)